MNNLIQNYDLRFIDESVRQMEGEEYIGRTAISAVEGVSGAGLFGLTGWMTPSILNAPNAGLGATAAFAGLGVGGFFVYDGLSKATNAMFDYNFTKMCDDWNNQGFGREEYSNEL